MNKGPLCVRQGFLASSIGKQNFTMFETIFTALTSNERKGNSDNGLCSISN